MSSMVAESSLRDLLSFSRDGEWGQDSPDTDHTPMFVIRGTDFDSVRLGSLVGVPVRHIPNKKAIQKQLIPNDILIEAAGGSKDCPTGRTVLIKPSLLEGLAMPLTAASFSRILRVDPTKASPAFIYWYLQYLYQSGQMDEYHLQHTGVARFQYTVFAEECRIPLPPVSVQEAIASILGVLDDKIELNRRMNRTLEALAQKLFKSWFVDFDPVVAKSQGRKPFGLSDELASLFPSEFEDSEQGPIPNGWRVSVIGQEASIVGGSTPATDEPEYWKDGRHCWVTPRDLSRLEDPVLFDTERKITDAGLARISSGLLPVGTVLLSSRAPIGYVAVAGVPTAINQGFIAIQCDKSLPNQFVRQWVSENMGEIEARAGGTTFAEISKSAFRPIPVLVPSTELLVAFQAQAETLFDRLSQNVKQSKALAKLRDLLLPRLLSGELRVPDAEREVEAIL